MIFNNEINLDWKCQLLQEPFILSYVQSNSNVHHYIYFHAYTLRPFHLSLRVCIPQKEKHCYNLQNLLADNKLIHYKSATIKRNYNVSLNIITKNLSTNKIKEKANFKIFKTSSMLKLLPWNNVQKNTHCILSDSLKSLILQVFKIH